MESPLQASVAVMADFSTCSQELLFAMLHFQEPAKISLIASSPGVQDVGTNPGKEAESQQAPTSESKYFICQGDVTVQLNNCVHAVSTRCLWAISSLTTQCHSQ